MAVMATPVGSDLISAVKTGVHEAGNTVYRRARYSRPKVTAPD